MSDARFYTLVLLFSAIAVPPAILLMAICFNSFAG